MEGRPEIPFRTIEVIREEGPLPLRTVLGGSYVASVTYKEQINKVDDASIVLSNIPYDVIESELVRIQAPLRITWGIVGSWTRSKNVRVKEVSYSYGVTREATLSCSDAKADLIVRKSGRTWTSKTSSEIVEDIAQLLGLEADVKPTTGVVRTVQGGRSYAAVIADLCFLEGYSWRVTDNVIVFKSEYEFSEKVKNYSYNSGTDPQILTFSVKETIRRISPAGTGTTAAGTDKESGAEVEKTEDPKKTKTVSQKDVGPKFNLGITFNPDGSYTPRIKRIEENTTGEVDTHPANEEEEIAEKRAKARTESATWKSAEATMTLLNRDIPLGEVIEIKGVSSNHGGNYKVKSISSSIGVAGIQQNVELSRNITRPTGKQTGEKPEGETSPQDDQQKGNKGGEGDKPSESANKKSFNFNPDGSYDVS